MSRLSAAFTLVLTASLVLPGVAGPRDMAAQVGPDGISVGEVQREMKTALGDRKVEGEELEILQAQTLGLLVNRQLVIQYLEKMKLGATSKEIDAEIERITGQLKRRGVTLEESLAQQGITYNEFRRSIAWEKGWTKYLDSKMTDENVQRYFEQHRREFDGTRLHVAHLLLKVEMANDDSAVAAVVERAKQIRQQIASGQITFADAARQHSEAPTADDGGDIGHILRHEPMPEPFSAAAYELKLGETSDPVVTTFGVHLVHCLGEEPGMLTLEDAAVEQAVREDLIRYLFLWVAEKQRVGAKITYTGALPYFDSSTGKLIVKK